MGKNFVYKGQKMILFYIRNSYILRLKLPKTPIFLAKIILYSSYILGKTWLTAWRCFTWSDPAMPTYCTVFRERRCITWSDPAMPTYCAVLQGEKVFYLIRPSNANLLCCTSGGEGVLRDPTQQCQPFVLYFRERRCITWSDLTMPTFCAVFQGEKVFYMIRPSNANLLCCISGGEGVLPDPT